MRETEHKVHMRVQEYAITSDEALTLEHMPGNSIVIVGAGYISIEFASIFRGFGADMHLMYRKALPLTGCVWPHRWAWPVPGDQHASALAASTGHGV